VALKRILVVDERADTWVASLEAANYSPTVTRASGAIDLLERLRFSAVLVVLDSPNDVALRVIARASARGLPIVVLAVSGIVDVERATQLGASAFAELPIEPSEAAALIGRALRLAGAAAPHDAPEILGASKAIETMRKTIARAAKSNATVLIRGESGTGKELVAKALHAQGPRSDQPMVTIHAAALPETLLESELFGYERGAFTGASTSKPGRVEAAQGGTLFLDEIGDLSPVTQVKMLRLLQDRTYERIGGINTLQADVRFIAATHRDLEGMVREGTFREDLFYRLNVVPVWTPPLRARHGDVEILARQFCRVLGKANGIEKSELLDDAIALIVAQRWPGNVRQLQNFIERLVVLCEHPQITAEDVQRELKGSAGVSVSVSVAQTSASLVSEVVALEVEVRNAERRALSRALDRAEGNKSLAARMLEVNRGTLYKKLREYGLE
jgi:two-component system, NtrC family, response regulator AtoC